MPLNSEERIKYAYNIADLQRKMLFKPYSCNEMHSKSLGYPLWFLLNAGFDGILLSTFMLGECLYGITTGNAEHIVEGAIGFGLCIVNLMLDITNALLTTLAFLTRSLVTLSQGYNISSQQRDQELEGFLCQHMPH